MKEARDAVLFGLLKNNLSHTWLISTLNRVKGIEVAKYNLSDILRGVRRTETGDAIIKASLEIIEEYEKWINSICK